MLYLDSSAIVKNYADEPDSGFFRSLLSRSTDISTSVVSYAEVMAALNRKRREGGISKTQFAYATKTFRDDWPRYLQVPVSSALNPAIDRLVTDYSLRGFDSIHLASALQLVILLSLKPVFVCADGRLLDAAVREGLETFEGSQAESHR